MHWGFFTCTVQQTGTNMWQSTGITYKQVMSVFPHDIINMHQFPVHTEHTKISHSLHTANTIMYSSNGCSRNVLVLQKRICTQFGPAFTIIWITSINYNLFNSHPTTKTVSTQHTSTYFPCRNVPCNNNDISYTGHITSHHITQYSTQHITQYILLYGNKMNIFNN